MNRRRLLQLVGASTLSGLAGCGALFDQSSTPKDTPPPTESPNELSPTETPDKTDDTPKETIPLDIEAEFPTNPTNPHITTAHATPFFTNRFNEGWQLTSYQQKQKTVLGLHPEALDLRGGMGFNGPPIDSTRKGHLYKGLSEGWFAADHGLPASKGQQPQMFLNLPGSGGLEKNWYRYLKEENKPTYPDGSVVTDPAGLAAETIEGEHIRRGVPEEKGTMPSVFAPGFLRWKVAVAEQLLEMGFARVAFDAIDLLSFHLDFSIWARTAFQKHLASLDADRLENLGIGDPNSFDVRAYFRERSLSGSDLQDPVVREYIIFHHEGIKAFFEAYAQRVHNAFPARSDANGINLYGNQFKFWRPTAIYLGDAFDSISAENYPSVPPNHIADYVHKLGLAVSKGEKPVRLTGVLKNALENIPAELDPTEPNETLIRLQLAEAYANGTIQELQLTGWTNDNIDIVANNLILADGSVHPEVQSLIDFIWTHRRHLQGGSPDNRIAVVYSLPTLIWQSEITGSRYPHRDVFERTANALTSNQLPYDATIFGHPRLWADPESLDQLATYDAVVLPGIESVTDNQVNRLESILDNGTSVIVLGDPPTRNEMYEERSDVRELLENHENASILSNEASDGEIADAVTAKRRPRVQVNSAEDLGVNLIRHDDRSVTVLHLVNYDYAPGPDEITRKNEVSVTVADLGIDISTAEWYTPESEPQSLEINEDGESVTVTVPEIQEWGFIAFAPSTDALKPSTPPATAQEHLSNARAAIETATTEGRTKRLTRAKIHLERAEKAASADAYDQVVEAAETAKTRAEEAYRPPVVGIDQTHTSFYNDHEERFDEFRSAFSDYDIRSFDDWTESSFRHIDLLIIPPLRPEEGDESVFTEREISLLSDFLEQGGSAIMVTRPEVASSMGSAVTPFGLNLPGGSIDGDVGHVAADTTKLTVMTPRWKVPLNRTTAIEINEGHVFARVYTSDAALVNRPDGFAKSSNASDTDSGVPIYAGTTHGRGVIAVFGHDTAMRLGDPGGRSIEYYLFRNALKHLGKRARLVRSP